jgi:hypothetical protein
MAALQSPSATRDRFDLERLADELAAREENAAGPSTSRLTNGGDASPPPPPLPDHALRALPVFVPLSHDEPHLSAPGFDVERFLLSRAAHAALPDLRAELREYHGALKEELVRLINDDYEAFISLSTDLQDEGATMERLRRPLGELRERMLVGLQADFRVCAFADVRAVFRCLEESCKPSRTRSRRNCSSALVCETKRCATAPRGDAAPAHDSTPSSHLQALLQLLLKISESVTRLESLLLIAAPPESSLVGPFVDFEPPSGAKDGDGDDR